MATPMTSCCGSSLTAARALTILVALGALAACGPDPAHMAWYQDYLALERRQNAVGEGVGAFDQLARRAPNHSDRCRAAMAAATLAWKQGLQEGCRRSQAILDDDRCREQHAQARYRLFECDLNSVATPELPDELLLDHPDSYWARAAFERVWQTHQPGQETLLANLFLNWYQRLDKTPLAGHALHYGALALVAASDPDSAMNSLQQLVEQHPDSSRWDEAVMLLANLLEEQGRHEEFCVLLLAALRTRAERGGRDDAFSTDVRWRLARLYEEQQDWPRALEQYREIINRSSSVAPKDDALWRSADIYATLGQQDAERRALQFLVEHCPWSRHVEGARIRLARP